VSASRSRNPPLLQFGQHLLGEKAQTLLLVRPDLVDEDVVIASDVIGSDRLQATGEKRARRSELIMGMTLWSYTTLTDSPD
jgi:hypothetical protein